MRRRAFLAHMTWATGALALAACRSAAPSATPASGATITSVGASSSPTAAASAAVTPMAATIPTTATPAATASRTQAPVTPIAGATAIVSSAQPSGRSAARLLPLFDTHVHYSQDAWDPIPIPQALELLDLAGTRVAMVSSTPDEGTIRLRQAAAPGRIIPILRPYRTRDDIGTWFNDPTLPPYLEERLALGGHRGFGEFHLYGDDARSAVVGQVLQLTARHNLLLHAHSDVRAIEHLFDRAPAARILWAHAGFTDPATLAQMIERYPRLWVETAIRGEIGSGGRFAPEWRELFLAFPERFMIGTDSYIVPRWVAMPTILGEVRAWCESVPAPVGEQLAWRNAARLMGVAEATFG